MAAAGSVLELACDLIARASVTPEDAGCQALLADRLAAAGFAIQHLPFGAVRNLWAQHRGTGKAAGDGKVLVLLGHTDVVPTGPESAWTSPPFQPQIRDGLLYGRGAADMKGSVAAMVVALERFVAAHPDHAGTVALLLTSDEEGEAIDGIRKVAEHFRISGQRIDHCLVGEPSSNQRLGDRCRAGRRGSLNGRLMVNGVQGHAAYPELADNPIHALAPALAELCGQRWDEGGNGFPPTSFQVSNINAGTGANNVIPGTCQVLFNFRYGTVTDAGSLIARTGEIIARHGLDHRLDWHDSGQPFAAPDDGRLRAAVASAVRDHCGIEPAFDMGGGTSDGRFIAPLGAEVIELGPDNASIHAVDEHVAVVDLERLVDIYKQVLTDLLVAA
ncbi:MAG: succinyl-diaminopimelate desuccinylase [Xanthomonadales bacterium]|nr:succinyl-diaminopimelate desuccinylase [Xanthomonadales bacterium]